MLRMPPHSVMKWEIPLLVVQNENMVAGCIYVRYGS
jgi:hypothetical protein